MRFASSRKIRAALASGASVLALLACGPVRSVAIARDDYPVHVEHDDHHHHHGPPPHAPAHGHRRKQHDAYRHGHHGGDVEIVFDSDLGVYVVLDLSGIYYLDGRYLAIKGDRWYASTHLDGAWEPCDDRALPPGLRKKHAKSGKRGWPHRGPARHDD
jgi:hypothetical protein